MPAESPEKYAEEVICSPWVPEPDPMRRRVLGKASEEAAELGAILARCLLQGLDESEPVTGVQNRAALEKEIGDVLATTRRCIEMLGLDVDAIDTRVRFKLAHLQRWERMVANG